MLGFRKQHCIRQINQSFSYCVLNIRLEICTEYQQSILPAGAKIFGLTAGLPVNLEGLVGPNGKVYGLDSFGFSAPYKVLDEKLGFTAQNVYNQVKEMLG